MLALDHRDVVLALQVKPELRAITKIVTKSHCGVGSDRPAPVQNVGDAA
jgi:hypothetical protein